jgi:hypothetical protein
LSRWAAEPIRSVRVGTGSNQGTDEAWTAHGNPAQGTEEQKKVTYHSQSTFVLPVQGRKDAFIYMGDRWNPGNAIDGRYVWLPIRFNHDGLPFLEWNDEWNLMMFDRAVP